MTNPVKPGANLYGADLRGANLLGADLYGADLREADFRGASLYGADLRKTNLRGADFSGADLTSVNLSGTCLTGTIFCDANIYTTNFNKVDFFGASFSHLIVKQGPIRSDGYQYLLFTSHFGGCVIRAGCRTWAGNSAFEEARQHCRDVTDKTHREEALRILDFLEKEFKAILAEATVGGVRCNHD